MRLFHLTSLLPLVLGWLVTDVGADNIAISPSADTCLFELDPAFNFGGQRDMPAGTLGSQVNETRSRALYKFDIASAIPQEAVITAARLSIDVVRTPPGKRNSTFGLFRVLLDWGEGNKRGDNPGGAAAEVGEATWAARFHPDETWSVPGGAFGSDFAQSASAERVILGNGTYVFEFNETGIADMQEMAANPEQNFGWLLATQLESEAKTARRWASRESRTVPPVLEIEFSSTPTAPLPDLMISKLPDSPTLQFSAHPSVIYSVFKSSDLETWENFATVGPFEAIEDVEVPDLQPARLTYYRVSVVNSSQVN